MTSTQPPGTVSPRRPSAGTRRTQTSTVTITVSKTGDWRRTVPCPASPRGPGRPRLTNGSPATRNRHRRSIPTLIPTGSGPPTPRVGTGPRSSQISSPAHRSAPSSARSTPRRLTELRAGPEHSSSGALASTRAGPSPARLRSARPRAAARRCPRRSRPRHHVHAVVHPVGEIDVEMPRARRTSRRCARVCRGMRGSPGRPARRPRSPRSCADRRRRRAAGAPASVRAGRARRRRGTLEERPRQTAAAQAADPCAGTVGAW